MMDYYKSFVAVITNLSEDPKKAQKQCRLLRSLIVGKRLDFLIDDCELIIGRRIHDVAVHPALGRLYIYFNATVTTKVQRTAFVSCTKYRYKHIESIYD